MAIIYSSQAERGSSDLILKCLQELETGSDNCVLPALK